jgi:hypothetical protein
MYEVTGQRALVTGNSQGGFLVTLWTTYLGVGGRYGYLPFWNYPDKF